MSVAAFGFETPVKPPRLWAIMASSVVPGLAREMAVRICDEVPEYSDDASGTARSETRRAVREAVTMFMAVQSGATEPDPRGVETFRRLGRLEARAGRSHDTLQNAYRIASQAATQRVSRWGLEHDAPIDSIEDLTTAIFEFIRELARYSAEGHAEALLDSSDTDDARCELARMLVGGDRVPRSRLERAADRAGWPLPETVTVVEVGRITDLAAADRVFGDALCARVADRCLAIVPGTLDIDAVREALRDAQIAVPFVVAPAVPLVEASSAARLAHRLRLRHDVAQRAVDNVALCADCMVTLVVDAGEDAIRSLAPSRLQPLRDLSPAKRVLYGRVLSAWLELGTINADEPGVLDKHRQTLRYQRKRLEAMFGDALQNRDARIELMLALRAELPSWERQAENYPNSSRRKNGAKS